MLWILVVSMASSKRQRRQDAGEPLGQHRLAGAGRADHQDVVAAGRGDFEGALGRGLAAHVAEIGRGFGFRANGRCATATAGENSSGRVEQRDHFGQVRTPYTLTPSTTAASAAFSAGTIRLAMPCSRAQTAIERAPRTGRMAPSSESSPMKMCWSSALHGAHRAQDPHGHGQVEAGAFLAHVGGREIDGDAFVGIAEAGVDERALDALAAFPDGDVGHADHDGIPRVAGCEHVDFDIDQVSIDAVNRGAAGLEQRHENGSGAM